MSIKRIWHGWVSPTRADAYENLLRDEIIPGIENKGIAGLQDFDLLRRDLGDEIEFVTIMTFASLQDVIDFQGEDYTRSYVPDAAQKVLARWDERAAHYEIRESLHYV
jgi:hypothetical protein